MTTITVMWGGRRRRQCEVQAEQTQLAHLLEEKAYFFTFSSFPAEDSQVDAQFVGCAVGAVRVVHAVMDCEGARSVVVEECVDERTQRSARTNALSGVVFEFFWPGRVANRRTQT